MTTRSEITLARTSAFWPEWRALTANLRFGSSLRSGVALTNPSRLVFARQALSFLDKHQAVRFGPSGRRATGFSQKGIYDESLLNSSQSFTRRSCGSRFDVYRLCTERNTQFRSCLAKRGRCQRKPELARRRVCAQRDQNCGSSAVGSDDIQLPGRVQLWRRQGYLLSRTSGCGDNLNAPTTARHPMGAYARSTIGAKGRAPGSST